MRLRTGLILIFAAVLTVGMTAVLAQQDDHAGHGHDQGEQEEHGQQGEMDPAAMMEMMQKMAAPGEHHEHMAHAIGDWKVDIKFWQMPGQEAMTSEGTSKTWAVLGGRYLQTEFSGSFMGMPFNGVGMDGFDKQSGKHLATWMDDFGTTMTHYAGTCEDGGKVTTLYGEVVDPMSGTTMKQKNVTTIVDNDTMRFDMYTVMPDGSEFKNMEITYIRQ